MPRPSQREPEVRTMNDEIRFACKCGKKYKVPASRAGRRVKCEGCERVIEVPSRSTAGADAGPTNGAGSGPKKAREAPEDRRKAKLRAQLADRGSKPRMGRRERTGGSAVPWILCGLAAGFVLAVLFITFVE